MLKHIKNFTILATLIILSACGSSVKEVQIEKPAKVLYEEATTLANQGADRKKVFSAYEEVERQHPQSDYAKKANADLIFYAYNNLVYDRVLSSAQSFIADNPSHKSTPKIHYLMALSYYEQIVDAGRDQSNTKKALETLHDIILAYPDSNFAISAKNKIDLTNDHLASKELSVGRFYQNNKDYQAALGRFQIVVNKYSQTSQTPEALARIVETYLALGLYEQAFKSGTVLGHNHPNSTWYAYSYKLLQKYKK